MRLFRQTNSIRKAIDRDRSAKSSEQAPLGQPIDTNTADEFSDVHIDLDAIEAQLAQIRVRQQSLLQPAGKLRKGAVEQFDLRTLINMPDEDDDEFDRRFDRFVSIDADDNSRRWMQTR